MLKQRIISTLQFFDLQGVPLTLLELHKYLLPDAALLKERIDAEGEILGSKKDYNDPTVGIGQVLWYLEKECAYDVDQKSGFYCLRGKTAIIDARMENYLYGIKREKLIKRWSGFLRHVPFVRGVALGGSQALGLQKPGSDIDLFLVVDSDFLWLSRILVTAYFQIIGLRRNSQKTANRFCLNHYVCGPKELDKLRNLYSAMEYSRHRPLAYPQAIQKFHQSNNWWMKAFYPNLDFMELLPEPRSSAQKYAEKSLSGKFGRLLEKLLEKWQRSRIQPSKFIIVEEGELSFHPHSKQVDLLGKFFEG